MNRFTWTLAIVAGLLTSVAPVAYGEDAAARCIQAVEGEGQRMPEMRALSPGVWWVRGERGDANAENRGQVSNLLVVREQRGVGQRVWLVGSGPSPMWARRLQCQISVVVGAPVTDVISPWARPELVLGAQAFQARHWAHCEVVRGMRRECAGCVKRLRQRLGDARTDLGSHPVEISQRRLRGNRGRLGPFEWTRLHRAKTSPVTLWYLPAAGVLTAHGLVWTGGVPDLRDTRLDELQLGLQRLQNLLSRTPGATILLGEQGPPAGPHEVGVHAAYLRALGQQLLTVQSEGGNGVDTPTALATFPPSEAHRLRDPQHALNWQRVWRQAD